MNFLSVFPSPFSPFSVLHSPSSILHSPFPRPTQITSIKPICVNFKINTVVLLHSNFSNSVFF